MIQINNYQRLLIIALFGFVFAFMVDKATHQKPDPGQHLEAIAGSLHRQEAEIDRLFTDTSWIKTAVNGLVSETMLEDFERKKYTVIIYAGDSLAFWSTSRILPFKNDVFSKYETETSFKKLKNGWYEFIKRTIEAPDSTEQELTMIGLIPVKYDYPIENEYLQNSFVLMDLPDFIQISPEETPFAVKNSWGADLFYLKASHTRTIRKYRKPVFVLYTLAFLVFFVFLHQTAIDVVREFGPTRGIIFLTVSIIFIRWLSIQLDFFHGFRTLELFNPKYFAQSDWMASLGEFLFNLFLVLWIILFFHRYYSLRNFMRLSRKWQLIMVAGMYLLMVGAVFGMSSVFSSLALNSEVSLAINNVFSLNVYSYIGLVGLTLLLVGFFFMAHKLTLLIHSLNLDINIKIAFLIGAILVFTLINLTNALSLAVLLLLGFSILFIVLFNFFVRTKELTITWVFTWLLVFAGFGSILLYEFNVEKELNLRKRYANKLAEEIDPETEYQFNSFYTRLLEDNFIKAFYRNPFVSRKNFSDRIDKRYIGGYLFAKYDYTIHFYDAVGKPMKSERVPYEEFVDKLGSSRYTSNKYLKFWTDNFREQAYIAKLPVEDGDRILGYLIIYFEPKDLKVTNVYPELLLDERLKENKQFEVYDYAIYKKNQRVDQKSKSYPSSLPWPETEDEFKLVDWDNKSNLVFRATPEKVIVVSRDRQSMIKPFSLFSYLFCLQLLVIVVFFSLNYLVNLLPVKSLRMNFITRPSMRNRINIMVIVVILISFFSIGAVTVIYFGEEFNKYHDGRLDRKVRGVLATANDELLDHENEFEYLPDVNKLAEIHAMDVNLYDLDGNLIELSQPDILDKGLISSKMDPVAFYNVTYKGLERYDHQEEINGLQYVAAYMPIRNSLGEKIAYLGLPYYSRQGNLRQDVSEFMSTLLNVYVFLLLIAGMVALFVGNSVTRPITAIGEKLRDVKLGEKNKPLTWENEDEIGALVEEYNKMIEELEKSATLLAQSNRESAWREMAKQVAHEIKNPLTPMKLSIQYLQRAVGSSDPEQVEALVKRVTDTLVEQIDNLSHIASEFSSFAKMPRAQSQRVELNPLVQSVYDLFKERENMELTLDLAEESFMVFADRNQLMRVFNNLIKNAIQAIPDDRFGKIQVRLYRQDNMAVVQVADNGVGIPEDKIESVFVPNFTTKSSGTGLGLAISRNIIESAAGKIYFDSEEGVGTQFYVEIPVIGSEKKRQNGLA